MKLSPMDICADHCELVCQAPRCRRDAVRFGSNGCDLPFCTRHLEMLSRAEFERLGRLASASPFDASRSMLAVDARDRALATIARRTRRAA